MPAFTDIFGQDKAVSLLTRTLSGGRLPTAFLFVGMEGVGKKLAALSLAQALNCTESGPLSACGRCPACLKVEKGVHPDVLLLSPEEDIIPVDRVRDMIGALSLVAFEGRMKVAVVDRAETMHWSAANALLKTLEEPPPRTLLILLTERPDALPRTIPSRCQRVKFSPLGTEAVAGWLRDRRGVPAERALLMAGLSEGSLGRALAMDEEFLDRRRRIFDEVLSPAQGGLAALFDTAKGSARDMEGTLRTLEGLLTDLLWVRTGRDGGVRNRDRIAEMRDAARRFEVLDLAEVYESVERVREARVRNVNPELALDKILLDAYRRGEGRKQWSGS